MQIINTENYSFSYSGSDEQSLSDITFSVADGEFITITGYSGCGKTTLLSALSGTLPCGNEIGKINRFFMNVSYVAQNPDNFLVTDTVRHELAFTAENMGINSSSMHASISEVAAFFGIDNILDQKLSELSGGQKQTVLIASAMISHPQILILDEPTAMLDPVSASKFIALLKRVHDETGTAVIIAEHRLSPLLEISDRFIVMNKGRIIADGVPSDVSRKLCAEKSYLSFGLPVSARLTSEISDTTCFSVPKAKAEFEKHCSSKALYNIPKKENKNSNGSAVIAKDIYFSYGKNNILKGVSFEAPKGMITAITGGNAAGKTTLLRIINGNLKPSTGTISVSCKVGLLTQSADGMFLKSTLYDDFKSINNNDEEIFKISETFGISHLMKRNPLDMSGGEKQRAGIAKLILNGCDIFLLDEPTKGLCRKSRDILSAVLKQLTDNGKTVILVSHDMDFCAENADNCAMLFDGILSSRKTVEEFFTGNTFFTTDSAKIAKNRVDKVFKSDDLIYCCTGNYPEYPTINEIKTSGRYEKQESADTSKNTKRKIFIAAGFITLVIAMLLNSGIFGKVIPDEPFFIPYITVIIPLLPLMAGFVPGKPLELPSCPKKTSFSDFSSLLIAVVVVPLTLIFGESIFGNKNYILLAMVVLLECLLIFFLSFENKKPTAKDIAVTAVLCATAIAGRELFFMFPQFKPVAAIVIISAAAAGSSTGFLIGSVTMLVSNLIFGQGTWTAWQMLAMGLLGYFSGMLFSKRRNILTLSIYGFLSTVMLYGTIMNLSTLISYQTEFNTETVLSYIFAGLPFDIIHGISTVIFITLFARPLLYTLERAKTKYGLYK